MNRDNEGPRLKMSKTKLLYLSNNILNKKYFLELYFYLSEAAKQLILSGNYYWSFIQKINLQTKFYQISSACHYMSILETETFPLDMFDLAINLS